MITITILMIIIRMMRLRKLYGRNDKDFFLFTSLMMILILIIATMIIKLVLIIVILMMIMPLIRRGVKKVSYTLKMIRDFFVYLLLQLIIIMMA
jgi:hypothetical protein